MAMLGSLLNSRLAKKDMSMFIHTFVHKGVTLLGKPFLVGFPKGPHPQRKKNTEANLFGGFALF